MHADCLHRSNHHCHHAHECSNPRHKSNERSKSREQTGNIAANLHHIASQNSIGGARTKKSTNKPKCIQPHSHQPNTLYERTLGCLKEKQKRVEQLQEELKKLRARRHTRETQQPPKEPPCLVQKEDYEAMYRFVRFENDRLKLETEEWRTLHQIALAELEIERAKTKDLEEKLSHRTHECERLAFLEQEIARLEKVKKEYEALLARQRKQQQEFKELKLKLSELSAFKEKHKDGCRSHNDIIKHLTQEKEALIREKELIRQRYDQHARHNIQLTDKLKEMKERNRIAAEELNAECKEKVKAADIKFGFSCDQINALRNSEAKLKAKIKDMEEAAKNQQTKAKVAHETKVEKQLRTMYEKSTKENESLREKSLKYQKENEELKETIRELRLHSEGSRKELEEVVRLKELENQNLQTAKAQTERQIQSLREADRNHQKTLNQLPQRQNNAKATQEPPRKPQSPDRPHELPSILDTHHEKENVDLFGTTSNQRVQLQTLQRRNAELQAEVGTLHSKLILLEKQASANNWSQFQAIIKENNRRIKELIIEKGKEIQANSFLRAEVEQLKGRLHQPITVDQTTNELYERNLSELQRLKNEVADRDFEVLQLRKEVYEVNNQYGDYYVLREDNEALRQRILTLTELVETLRRSGIHNSYQKQQLIMENQYLTEQVDRNRLLRLP